MRRTNLTMKFDPKCEWSRVERIQAWFMLGLHKVLQWILRAIGVVIIWWILTRGA